MSDKRNATASWSGYLHQGKVGIFVALKKINELLEAEESLDNWQIIYENAEDFDIQKLRRNGDIYVDSRHQVKANILTELNPSNKKSYYRCAINNFNVSGTDEETDCYLHTVEKIIDWDTSKSKINNNKKHINLYKHLYSLDKDILENLILSEIKLILNSVDHIEKNNLKWCKNILEYLLYVLDNKIREAHSKKLNIEEIILSFNSLRKKILSNNEFKISNLESLRKIYANAFSQCIIDLEEPSKAYDQNIDNEIQEKIESIYINDNLFFEFLKEIHPDEIIADDLSTVNDISKICKIDNLKDVFFYCILSIYKNKYCENNFSYSYLGKTYFLSNINRIIPMKNSLVKAILSNKSVSKVFDNDYLINGQISDENQSSFESYMVRNTNDDFLKKYVLEKSENYDDKFLNPKLKFISASNAIEKLNK